MKNILRIFSLFLIAAVVTSCHEDKKEKQPPRADNRVYFIYMAGDNNLSYYPDCVTPNLDAIQRGATSRNIGEGRILVFCDRKGFDTELIEFRAGADGRGKRTLLKSYGSNLNTASVDTFLKAIEDMKEYSTADGQKVGSYILDMWSHGDAWETHSRSARQGEGIMPLSVANNGSSYLELEDFVEALEPGLFDAVIFAQCYGASVEMLYLLREKTSLVLGSAPEMGVYGVPYNRVLSSIFAPQFDYQGYIDAHYEEYKDQNSRYEPGGTLAAFDCDAFDDTFIDLMSEIYASNDYANAVTELTQKSNYTGGKSIGIQTYSNNSTNSNPFKYFDIGDLVNYVYPEGSDIRERFWNCMNDIVLYKRTTGNVFEISIDHAKYSGISTYIMLENWHYNSGSNSLNAKYRETSWYKATYPSL